MEPNLQYLPFDFQTFEFYKRDGCSEKIIIWVDRFLQKYELAACFISLRTEQKQARFSRDAVLFGLVLAYKAYEDIAELCLHLKFINTLPEHLESSDKALHSNLISNSQLCAYLGETIRPNEAASDILLNALNSTTTNVLIFGYSIFQFYLDLEFTPRNLGIRNAKEKETINLLRDHILDLADKLFTQFVTSVGKG